MIVKFPKDLEVLTHDRNRFGLIEIGIYIFYHFLILFNKRFRFRVLHIY